MTKNVLTSVAFCVQWRWRRKRGIISHILLLFYHNYIQYVPEIDWFLDI